MKITESQILSAIRKVLLECDADTLATIAGQVLGGNCFPSPDYNAENDVYDFEADENYTGAFDEGNQ